MIPCSDRRCQHTSESGVRCITRLCRFNPGPDCYAHSAVPTRPSITEQERLAFAEFERMAKQPDPRERIVA